MEDAMEDYVDEKLATAFHDVPVPAGLADRLLDRLAAQRAAESRLPSGLPVVSQDRRGGWRFRSRRWLLTSAAALAATCVARAIWLGARREETVSQQYVLDEAIRLFGVTHQEEGHLLAKQASPSDYRISGMVQHGRGTRWRSVDDFLGHVALVYDLPGRPGTRAALYAVADLGVEGLDTRPALRPFTTGGCCASAWQEGSVLYVLVVQGDPAAYGTYLNLPRGPLA